RALQADGQRFCCAGIGRDQLSRTGADKVAFCKGIADSPQNQGQYHHRLEAWSIADCGLRIADYGLPKDALSLKDWGSER
ncbi:MAG TPA: hypothetical protein PK395_16220, partial [bacterium]|nr:hypothetical protein [bacterium]